MKAVGPNFQNEKKYNLSLLGINLKTVTTNEIENRKIVPLGNCVGLKLYTKGVLVVGTNEIEGEDKKIYKPYQEAGIEQGDSITKINNEEINSTKKLIECVSKSKNKKLDVTFIKNGKEMEKTITPIKTGKNTYKLGLWVRDSSAGIGTLTFYDKLTNSIVSLGHGIQDIDTGEIVNISNGEFVTCKIKDIQKGEKNSPGKLEGSLENSSSIGNIYENTNFGVYGHLKNTDEININKLDELDMALRDEIKEGNAQIICMLDSGDVSKYTVNIQKIFKNNNKDNKSMIIKITDKRLLEKTGGIIQGMSGSPIVQNGKFVGALTHVLVSDPTCGYGVFADLMAKELR